MTPLSLILQGIYSYKEKVEIDFSRLAASGVFGIFGAVGSGKSTILEAISYVLYGQSSRLNRKDNLQYNMMNLQSNEMRIEFIFEHRQKKYLFTYYAKRSSKHIQDISRSERKAYLLEENGPLPIEPGSITEILQLEYEDFRRIVIIPQGLFGEFISLGPKDRAEMLKGLFQLEQYDLSDKVKALEKENDDHTNQITGKLSELADISEEQSGLLQIQLDKIEKEAGAVKIKYSEARAKVEHWNRIHLLSQEIIALKAAENELLQKDEAINTLKQTLDEYRFVLIHYKGTWERLKELRSEYTAAAGRFDRSAEIRKEIRDTISGIKEVIGLLSQKYGSLELQQALLEKVNGKTAIREWQTQIALLVNTKEQQEAMLRKLRGDKASIEQRIEALNLKKKELEPVVEKEAALRQLSFDLQQMQNLDRQIAEQAATMQDIDKRIEYFINERIKIARFIAPDKNNNDAIIQLPVSGLKQFIEQQINSNRKEIQELKDKAQEIIHMQALENYAQNLNEEDPCPLCGSRHHPLIYSGQNASLELQSLRERIATLEQFYMDAEKAILHIEHLIRNFQNEQSMQDKTKGIIAALTNERNELQSRINKIPGTRKPDTIEKELQHINEARMLLKTLNAEVESLYAQTKTLDTLQAEQSLHHTLVHIEKLYARIDTYPSDIREWETDEDLGLVKDALHHNIPQLKEQEQQLLELERQALVLEEQYNHARNSMTEARQKLEQQEQEWNNRLLQEGRREEDIVQVLDMPIEIEASEQAIRAHQSQKDMVQGKLRSMEQEMAASPYDEAAHQHDMHLLQQLEETYKNILQEQGALLNNLNYQKEKLQVKKQLQEELQSRQLRQSNLKVLNNLFKGQGFVKYVSQRHLRNLFQIANERFMRFTQNQLQLDIDTNGNFIVIDYLNNGYPRLLKTLSGGQTFQASLSLALALSEQIQYIHKAGQQFFFLDEGFGSLDKEALTIVMDSLKQLRAEGRIVGLISHVEELKAEIDYYLEITNDGERGSIITKMY